MKSKNDIINDSEIKSISIDNNTLSMSEIITKIDALSKNENPYHVSKEIEDLKSIFYIKLKEENQEKILTKNLDEEESQKEKLNPLEINFKAVFNNYRKIKSEFRKKKEQEEKKNLKTKKQIIEDINTLSKEQESIKITFEKFRILQEKWKNTGHVPITENNHLWQSYHHHIELFYDFIKLNKDLRDLDFQRNLEEKTKICEKAEALVKEKSIHKAHEKLQELHEHWRNIGPVERTYREPIWERFQQTSKEINKQRNNYFLEKKEKDTIRLEKKKIISAKIKLLASDNQTTHTQWKEATNKCHKLQEEWKNLGGLNKEYNKIAWEELRESLNDFYENKKTFYKEKKKNNKEQLNKKISICEKAEKLISSKDWKTTTTKFINLQKEWENSEFTPGKKSNEIWKRFRSACDTFFKAKKRYYKKIEKEQQESYREKEKIINQLETFQNSSNSKKDIETLNELNKKWEKIGYVPKDKININSKFINLLNLKFSDLGLTKKELENVQYKNKISVIKGNTKAINSEQKSIRNKIENLQKEIIQYENNIAFFGSGKATKPLLEQAQNKINNVKSDIENLKQKIKLLNKA